jgi:glutamine amidotransferase
MIAIVDYKAGNLTSVKLALAEIGRDAVITADPAVLVAAERVIFPGVGAAGSAMAELDALGWRRPRIRASGRRRYGPRPES